MLSWKKIIGELIIVVGVIVSYSFSYQILGIKWDKDNIPVDYYINYFGTPDCPGENSAIISSFNSWETVSGQYMDFTYKGPSSETYAFDGTNLCVWIESGWPEEWYGAIAMASIWFNELTGEILEVDITFNGEHFEWSSSGQSNKIDVQNIATHEIGHFVGLDDLYHPSDSEATMYGYSWNGDTTKRSLSLDDRDGIRAIYPGYIGPKTGDYVMAAKVSMINNLINLNKEETCSIGFQLFESKRIKIKIYTIDGELVKSLADDPYEEGSHWVFWSGKNDAGDKVGAGIYLVRFNITEKIYKIAVIK
ncbi:matrixin family metalloprotease [bacterium]|nr:matrixin family metalloprotease [bacterium]